jgi:hypothetical protein
MERLLIALVGALALAGSALAQVPADVAPERVEVSDADLERFATVYVALQEKADEYEAQMLRVRTEEEARDVQTRMQQESVAAVNMHGWTPEQYVAIAQAINADPELAERTRRLIDVRE